MDSDCRRPSQVKRISRHKGPLLIPGVSPWIDPVIVVRPCGSLPLKLSRKGNDLIGGEDSLVVCADCRPTAISFGLPEVDANNGLVSTVEPRITPVVRSGSRCS